MSKKKMKEVVIRIIIITFLIGVFSILSAEKWGVVKCTHGVVNIRSDRSITSKIVGKLEKNEIVKVDYLKDNWYAVFRVKENERKERNALGYVYAPLLFDTKKSDNTEILSYTILKDDVYDVPVKTQVQLDVLIEDNEVTEKKIRYLLNHLFNKTIKRTGFKYHNNPTNVYIYAYTTKEKAESGMGQWLGMISNSYDDITPQINISEIQLNSLSMKPKEKFGLSESKRTEIWNKYIMIDDRAYRESNAKYPLDDYDITMDDMKNNAALYVKLKKKYKKELTLEYGIGEEVIESIISEGISKGWAFPSR